MKKSSTTAATLAIYFALMVLCALFVEFSCNYLAIASGLLALVVLLFETFLGSKFNVTNK